jgi:hypothetical protein
MQSYYQSLIAKSEEADVPLLKAFIKAGVPTSTYYRTVGGSELKHVTAKKVWIMLELLINGRTYKRSDKKKLTPRK